MYATYIAMLKKQILTSLIIFLTFFFCAAPVFAQDPEGQKQCGGDDPASALFILEPGLYGIYAEVGAKNISEAVTLLVQEISYTDTLAPCLRIGSVTANDSAYTKVPSSYTVGDGKKLLQYFYSSASSSSSSTAAAPSVVFVSSVNAGICDVSTGCIVTYKGQQFKLSPKKISLTSDSLRAGLLLPYEHDTVKSVTYTVDGKPVYEKKTLEKFNERYVTGGDHILGRTVLLSSGQTLSDSRSITRGTFTEIGYLFEAFFFGQSRLITIIGGILAFLIVWSLFLAILRAIRRRRIWKQTHSVGMAGTFDSSKAGPQKNFSDESVFRTLMRYKKFWASALGLVALFLITTTYIVGFFTVDGVSMLPTLKDKSVHPLVRVQRTISSIDGTEYVPKRGTIVVINKDENNLFDQAEELQKHYVVKRVIGLPHERVTIKNGKIMIYDEQHKDGFEPDAQYHWTTKLTGSEAFSIDITLKDSEIFVMGDHRDESIDSRFYGPLNVKEITGSVVP